MDKQFIISEIHRTAKNGKALGQARFTAETNIKVHEWRGKYWARWSNALTEAGYQQNAWTSAPTESHILESLLQLTRKLGKFPTRYEIALERSSSPGFPSYDSVNHLCSRAKLREKLLEYCSVHSEYASLEDALQSIPTREETSAMNGDFSEAPTETACGYVYLVSGQAAYKIGSTRAPYRRVAEIANQSAMGAELLHLISTDDPEGIEDYWHRRFNDKRIAGINKQSGEWFQLSAEEIKAFKRRKTM